MRLAGIEDTTKLLEKQLGSKMSKMILEEALMLVQAFSHYLTLMGIVVTHHRQFHKSSFDKSDLFFLYMLHPLFFNIQKQEFEIEATQD
ncbi:Phosphoenolpyruvate carboxylase 4 [Camellia lanceoleosa]|uniref:Phosphoenolpyruvate carboxylase 4 n=1 Tax=Camellia lanceoleosa TaxID=1840588 RepID=A0ACC0GMT7_9ERIC|nr:Phosphoenolpyruvate carboxylase 4 [Camellia lanceoleosa]